MESYAVLKKAFEKPGTKKIAAELGLSQSLVYKWSQNKAEPDDWQQGGAVNPLDRIKQIYTLTGDMGVISWICQSADGFFVKNPVVGKKYSDIDALRNIQMIIRDFSEALDAISKSYNDDKNIDQREAQKIRSAWEDLKQVGEAFVKECEAGDFNTKITKKKSRVNKK